MTFHDPEEIGISSAGAAAISSRLVTTSVMASRYGAASNKPTCAFGAPAPLSDRRTFDSLACAKPVISSCS